jgi:multisubunit Na+/H+ antiporter MnhG subunit
MENSKKIAGLLGPTIVAMVASEFPLVQPHLYDAQIPPVVYLSGVLMFVGGLAIVRAHNVWVRNWTSCVTLSGWFFLVLGLTRMFAASSYQRAAAGTSSQTFMALESALIGVGAFLSYKAYSRADG